MAEPTNVIFRIRTEVEGADAPKQLAAGIEQTDEAYKGAQKTMTDFERKFAAQTVSIKKLRAEQDALSASTKNFGTEVGKGEQRLQGMGATISKAAGQFQTFTKVGSGFKDFLSPATASAQLLAVQAKKTGENVDEMAAKMRNAGNAPISNPSAATGTVVGASPSAIPSSSAASGASGQFREVGNEAKILAATLLSLGSEGQAAFDELNLSAQSSYEVMREVVAIASQTPEGIAALAQDLDAAQVAALDTLQAEKAIDAEQRKLIESALKLKAAAGGAVPEVKKTAEGYGSLRTQLRAAKAELDKLIEASDGNITPGIIAAAKKAGELQDRFEDLNATVDAFNPDKKFQTFANVAQNVAGGFTAIQGAMGLVGAESEGVQKSLLKVQSALAITQGLQALFGGLRDNLKNIRLLLGANAVASRTLAVAEGEAAAGAAVQSTQTGILSGVVQTARASVISFYETLLANPIGIIVAAIGVLIYTIYALATANEEATVKADDLLAALERVAKAKSFDISRDKSEAALENERQALEAILALEKERAALPSNLSAQEKAFENLRIDVAEAEVERKKNVANARLDATTSAREAESQAENRKIVEAQIAELYRKGGYEFLQTQGRIGKAALEALKARIEMTETEANQALIYAGVRENLSKEEVEGLDKLMDARDKAMEEEKKNLSDINAANLKGRNSAIQYETDLTKAKAKEEAERAKLADEGAKRGTIASLQEQQKKISDALNKQLTIGSPEFFKTVEKYLAVTKELRDAQALLQGTTVFPAGSFADLNQELSFLKEQLQTLPAGVEFDKVASAVKEIEAAIEALNERMKPKGKDAKAETARRLAELQEEERHTLALAEVDAQAAETRARNEGKSEAEIAAIIAKAKKEQLNLEIDYALKRLEILKASGTDNEAEVKAQENKLKELRAQAGAPTPKATEEDPMKKLLENVESAGRQIAEIGFNAWNAWSDAQAAAIDQQISLEQGRVAAAEAIAEKGNAAQLAQERERLAQLLDERRKAAEKSAAIAQAEAAVQAALAIVKVIASSASLGPVGVVLGIAAAIGGLTAGIAQARSVAASGTAGGFYKGGLADWSTAGGYTGDGNPRAVAHGVGRKPYEYHRKEFVMDHQVTGVGRNRQWFEKILRGRMDIDHMMGAKTAIMVRGGGVDPKQVDRIVNAIERQPKTSIRVDETGLSIGVERTIARRRAIRRKL